MKCTKAILPVAGWGTRWLPITKTIEKCMLPVGNRPIVDYVVQDCLAAGIRELIFVVGEDSTQIEKYYRSNIKLNNYLRRYHKTELLPVVAAIEDVKLHFVTQPSHGKYGTAVPVALAAEYIEPGESVVVLMGDDFFYNADGSSETARLIDAVRTAGAENGMLAASLDADDTLTGRYGLIEEDTAGNLIRIIEHPEVIPEPFLKNVSKYLLSYELVETVKTYVATGRSSEEYYIFAPFEEALKQGASMKVVRAKGRYLDVGTPRSWLEANTVVLSDIDKK